MKFSKQLIFASMLTVSLVPVFGQDPSPASPAPGGWRRFDQSNPADAAPPPPAYEEPQAQTQQAPPAPGRYQTQPPPAASYPPPPVYPSSVTIPAGTWITVRVEQPLSSDKNHDGDYFRATIAQPIVINGLVVAPRGQTATGVVTEAKKAGRVEGTSRLGLELTELGLADGRQLPVKTTLTERRGNTSYGRDAFAIGATTATGAAIGAGVNGGVGAGVGAAAGLVVSTVGVLLTRGRPTIVYPESVLSFRLANPITVDGTQAFHPVSPQDYGMTAQQRPGYGPGYGAPGPGYGAPGGYAAPYPYYPFYGGFGPYSGYLWSPGFGFYYGRGFRRW